MPIITDLSFAILSSANNALQSPLLCRSMQQATKSIGKAHAVVRVIYNCPRENSCLHMGVITCTLRDIRFQQYSIPHNLFGITPSLLIALDLTERN